MDKVQVKSEKHFSACISFLLSFVLIFSFISCGNLFGNDDSGSSSDSKKIEKIDTNTEGDGKNTGTDSGDNDDGSPKYVTFKGTVFLSDSAKTALEVSSALKATDSATSRSAIPSIEIDGSEYYYFATATCTGQEDINGVFGGADGTRHDFELPLALGHTWNISAGIKKRAASGNAEDDVIVLIDSVPPVTIPLDFSGNFESYSFYVKPLSSGKGSVLLLMTVDSSVKKVRVSGSTSEWTSVLTPVLKEDGSYEAALNIPELAAGFYEVRFNFCDDNDIVLYSTVQTVNVFANLTTDSWKTSGGNSSIISAEGKFSVTDELIRQFRKNTVYVGENALSKASESSPEPSDFNTGTVYSPFLSLQQAINYIEANALEDDGSGSGSGGSGGSGTGGSGTSGSGAAGSQVYTVFVSGSVLSKVEKSTGTAEGVATIPATITSDKVSSINIQGVTGALCLTSGGSTVPAEINGGLTQAGENGSVLDIRTQVPVRFENIKITGANKTGSGSGGSGGTASDSDGGAVILRSGTSVTFANGTEISRNYCTGKGGAIFAEESFTVSGSIYIPAGTEENWKNDVYLADGKTVIIAGAISAPEGALPAGAPVVMNITPENYAYGKQILSEPDGSNTLVSENYGFFAVNSSYDEGTGKVIKWALNDDGTIEDTPYARVAGVSYYNLTDTFDAIKNGHSGADIDVILYEEVTQDDLGKSYSSSYNGKIIYAIYRTNANSINLVIKENANIQITGASALNSLFQQCDKLASADLRGLNISGVTSLYRMFYSCYKITSVIFPKNFDTSSVTDMSDFLKGCNRLANLVLSDNFDTSNVTNMSGMFSSCYDLTDLSPALQKMNTEQVTNMNGMFYSCSGLTQLDLSLGNFDTSKVTNMTQMFCSLNNLTDLDLGSSFDTKSVTNMTQMFYGLEKLSEIDFGNKFNTSAVTSMSGMFANCKAFTELDLSKCNFDTSSVTNMSGMFQLCSSLTAIDFGTKFNTSAVTSMSSMFAQCSSLPTLEFPSSFVTSRVQDMSYMFKECTNLQSLDLRSFDTSLVTKMYEMFYYCKNMTTLDVSSFNTENVVNLSSMFYYCEKLASLDLSNFHTPKLGTQETAESSSSSSSSMQLLFYGCKALKSLNISNFETTNVKNMFAIFCYCNSLQSIDVSSFVTNNVTNMSQMFQYCSSLQNLDVSNFNTEKVTSMSYMFSDCSSLSSIEQNFDTQKVTNMNKMFRNCSNLAVLDLTNFKTPELTSIDGIFYQCSKLTTIYVTSDFDTSLVTSGGSFGEDEFKYCSKLVGGAGTAYSYSNVSYVYARIDDPDSEKPGYFTSVPLYATVKTASGTTELATKEALLAKIEEEKNNGTNQIEISLHKLVTVEELGCNGSGSLAQEGTIIHALNGYTPGGVTLVICGNPITGLELSDSYSVGLFNGCESLTAVKVHGLDVTGCSTMAGMFKNCTNLREVEFKKIDTKNISNMQSLFEGCSNLETITLKTDFDVSSVTESTDMFKNCVKLEGAAGTTYSAEKTDAEYARVDMKAEYFDFNMPGYFTCYASINGKVLNNLNELYSEIKASSGHIRAYFFNGVSGTDLCYYYTDGSIKSALNTIQNTNAIESADIIIPKKAQIKIDPSIVVDDENRLFYYKNKMKNLDLRGLDFSEITSFKKMFYQGSASNIEKIVLDGVDVSTITDMSYMFSGCHSLTDVYISDWDISNVTTLSAMFSSCISLKNISFDRLTVSPNPVYAYSMFGDCRLLESVSFDINDDMKLHLSSLASMFNGCSKLVSVPANSFDTSLTTDIVRAFYNCESLTELDLSNFDTSNVTSFESMFQGCSNLETLNIKNFDTSTATKFSYMFKNCSKLKTIYASLDFDFSSCTSSDDRKEIFDGCASLVGALGKTYNSTYSSYYSYTYAKLDRGKDNKGFFSYYAKVGEEYCFSLDETLQKIEYAYGETPVSLSRHVTSEALGNSVTSGTIANAIMNSSGLINLDVSIYVDSDSGTESYLIKLDDNNTNLFSGCSKLKSSSMLGFDTSETQNMSGMFKNCSSLEELELSGFDSSSLTNMDSMFEGCYSLKAIYVSNGFKDCPLAASSADVFKGCTHLTGGKSSTIKNSSTNLMTDTDGSFAHIDRGDSDKGYFRPHYGLIETEDRQLTVYENLYDLLYAVINASQNYRIEFYEDFKYDDFRTGTSQNSNNGILNSISNGSYQVSFEVPPLSNIKVKVPEGNFYLFGGNKNVVYADLRGFDVSDVTGLKETFSGCTNLRYVDIRYWDSSEVTDMEGMFKDCSNLETLKLDGLNTENVTTMKDLFNGCSKLESLKAYVLDTGKVTNMDSMFENCSSIKEISLRKSLNSNENKIMDSCFNGCTALETVDLSNFEVTTITSVLQMFYNCSSLTEVKFASDYMNSSITNMTEFFAGCSSLRELNLGCFDFTNVSNVSRMFSGCTSLETIYADDTATRIKMNVTNYTFYGNDVFKDCTSLSGKNGSCPYTPNGDGSYTKNDITSNYFCIDSPDTGMPGYLTSKNDMSIGG